MFFKFGDASLSKNFRPITITPVLAKLFNTALSKRIKDMVGEAQPEEQKSTRGCCDAAHVLHMVTQKSKEWGQALWMAAMNVEKLFVRIYYEDLY